MIPNGVKNATTDPEKIKKWWTQWPDANVGVATGKKSFIALDVDMDGDGPETLRDLCQQHEPLPDTLEQITGSGGRQIFFSPTDGIENKVRFASGLDTRSDDGLVVMPPSLHPTGNKYEWEASSRPDISRLQPMPEWLTNLIRSADGPHGENGAGVDPGKLLEGIEKGQRDNAIFKYACRLRGQKVGKMEAQILVKEVARRCKPPFPEKDAMAKVDQAYKYPEGHGTQGQGVTTVTSDASDATDAKEASGCIRLQTVQNRLQTVTNSPNYLETFKIWLETCDGQFKMADAARELGWYENRNHYAKFRMAVSRAVQSGLIAKVGSHRGIYRNTIKLFNEMNILDVHSVEFPMVLPLDLHKLVQVNPKEIILIAGETNAGKSCLVFNILWDNLRHLQQLNMLRPKNTDEPKKIGLRYFSSEMGPAVVRKKLLDFGPAYPIEEFVQNVTSIECNHGFQDILDPSGINCIDYLEPPEGDYYRIAPTISEIYARLEGGVAVIAIQKRRGTDIGRGGEGTLEKPRLAIALSYDRDRGFFTAKIVKAKHPRDKPVDGLERDFTIERGVSILPVSEWDYPENHEKRRKRVSYRNQPPPPDPDAYFGKW